MDYFLGGGAVRSINTTVFSEYLLRLRAVDIDVLTSRFAADDVSSKRRAKRSRRDRGENDTRHSFDARHQYTNEPFEERRLVKIAIRLTKGQRH